MSQRPLWSFIEANTNAAIGLVISYVFTLYGLPLFGLEPTAAEAVGITAAYFFLSIVRSYILRRIFDAI